MWPTVITSTLTVTTTTSTVCLSLDFAAGPITQCRRRRRQFWVEKPILAPAKEQSRPLFIQPTDTLRSEFQLEIFLPVQIQTVETDISICTGWNRLQCRCSGALNSIPDGTISSLPSCRLRTTPNAACPTISLRCPTSFTEKSRPKSEQGRAKKQLSCTQCQRP